MLNMIHIRFLEYKRMWPVVVSMTVMAIVFIYTFGIGFSQEIKSTVVIVDEDQSKESQNIIDALVWEDKFEIINLSYEEAVALLEKNKALAVIVIPSNFHVDIYNEMGQIDFIKIGLVMEHTTLEMSLKDIVARSIGNRTYINQIEPAYEQMGIDLDKERMYLTIEDLYRDRPMLKLNISTYESSAVNFYDSLKQSFMGFMLFFSLFTMVFGIGSIVEDKQNRVWHRQRVSPLTGGKILGSALIVGFIVGFIQLGLMILSGKYLFNIDLGESTLALLLVISAYIIAAMSLGLCVSGLVKTEQQLGAISPMIIVGTSMIGGCMWPLEMVTNPFIKNLSIITPQRWAMEGLQKVIIYKGTVSDVTQPILYLLILTIFFFVLAMIPYKKVI